MFATYLTLAQEACEVVKAHKERLVDQVAQIISDGVKQGAFQVTDAKVAARAVFDATTRYHHPAHSDEWKDPARSARIDALLGLLLRSLEAPRKR
jgi:cell division ATPase FtsA